MFDSKVAESDASGQSAGSVLPGLSARQTQPSGLFPRHLKRKYLYSASNDEFRNHFFIDAAGILTMFLLV